MEVQNFEEVGKTIPVHKRMMQMPIYKPPNVTLQNSLDGYHPRWPEFIITGMQKCGTGALKEYLRLNPFLSYSDHGESHFFDRKYDTGLESYLHFQPTVTKFVKIFDKTPSYMSNLMVPERIYHYYPNAKLVFLLCEPRHRTISHYLHAIAQKKQEHWTPTQMKFNDSINSGMEKIFVREPELKQTLYNTNEKFTRFDELRAAIYRYFGSLDNSVNWGPVQVIVRGAYAYYLEQYRKFFPRENMLVLNSDDLKVAPWKAVMKTQKFFEVQVTVTEKNFIKNQTTGQFCYIGPGLPEPQCLSEKKNRSKDKSMDRDTFIILGRVFKALKQDLDKWVGNDQFYNWTYDDF